MAGYTSYLNLAFFDFADRLDYAINVQREVDRFTVIDKQLYGLSSVFGNGVISGWEVFDNGYSETSGISIGISSGLGLIQNIATQTFASEFLDSLIPESIIYLYANIMGSSITDRRINFILSSSDTLNSPSNLLLSKIVTSSNGIVSIDDTVRTNIGFEESILTAINNHRHRGLPSKIDLLTETKNLLSGSRLESFDASKISSGIFNVYQIPVLDHNKLNNIGSLTHAQIDTFVQSLSSSNQGLFGEISVIDQLHQIMFLKAKYPTVDKYFDNEISIIPGISSDSQIDFYNSAVFIDKGARSIIGLPVSTNNTYFFTSNFSLSSPIKKMILTSHKSIPVNSQIIFGINTTNSVIFSDYQVIEEDKLQDIVAFGDNLRIGIKFVYTGGIDVSDPYNFTFKDFVDFGFVNSSLSPLHFHFRIRWYTDMAMSHLFYTAFSSNDKQEGWLVNDTLSVPPEGYLIEPDGSIVVTYFPDLSLFHPFVVYYLNIDAWDGTSFSSETVGYTFITERGSSICDQYGYLPQVKNFACMFSLENDEKVKLNL